MYVDFHQERCEQTRCELQAFEEVKSRLDRQFQAMSLLQEQVAEARNSYEQELNNHTARCEGWKPWNATERLSRTSSGSARHVFSPPSGTTPVYVSILLCLATGLRNWKARWLRPNSTSRAAQLPSQSLRSCRADAGRQLSSGAVLETVCHSCETGTDSVPDSSGLKSTTL